MKSQYQHRCDTESPTRPCCWMARRAELEAMDTPEARAKQAQAAAEKKARIEAEGGFITRGID